MKGHDVTTINLWAMTHHHHVPIHSQSIYHGQISFSTNVGAPQQQQQQNHSKKSQSEKNDLFSTPPKKGQKILGGTNWPDLWFPSYTPSRGMEVSVSDSSTFQDSMDAVTAVRKARRRQRFCWGLELWNCKHLNKTYDNVCIYYKAEVFWVTGFCFLNRLLCFLGDVIFHRTHTKWLFNTQLLALLGDWQRKL